MTTDGPVDPPIRVSTLELFFDLVFVFTVTQLTDVLVHHLDGVGVARVLLMLGMIWWMYSGYVWLTNAVAPSSTTRRTFLLSGMAGFLVIALAIPEAFGESRWVFGVGYLLVNTVHTTLFIRASDASTTRAVLSLAPFNLASALLVFGGGFAPNAVRYGLWSAALALQIATPYLHRLGQHRIVAGHFVERHGLVIIVAIGESIVAIGLGFAGLTIDLGAITVAVLGLCIAYYLWWAYFAGDDERSEHVLRAITDPLRRARVAVQGWGYAHGVMILGIVALATGIKKTVGHAFDPLSWGQAIVLGSGAALYLVGHAWFLRILHIPGPVYRLVAAALILAAIPLGYLVAVAQLVAILVIMAGAAITEDLPAARRARSSAIHTFGRTASTAD